jgi:hypothetical protein
MTLGYYDIEDYPVTIDDIIIIRQKINYYDLRNNIITCERYYNVDEVILGYLPFGEAVTNGITSTFKTVDGLTVTIKNGLVVSIK